MVGIRALMYFFTLVAVRLGNDERYPWLMALIKVDIVGEPHAACINRVNFSVVVLGIM